MRKFICGMNTTYVQYVNCLVTYSYNALLVPSCFLEDNACLCRLPVVVMVVVVRCAN